MKKDRKDNPMSLVLKNVSKTFDDTNQATLKNVDLEIKQGEFLCVVGRSGCGKSTLLNLIAGLEKPTSGEILLNGKPVTGRERTARSCFRNMRCSLGSTSSRM